ncbi:MAG: hypothetical protein KTR24_02320, partial [Saprospiraceae bacterium]|nr:hypothetical protein [Saprospiraceae bacterium]
FLRSTLLSTPLMRMPLISSVANPSVEIVNPRNRVPINFIIDDSTALVNMAHYGIPQFKQTFPSKYTQDWRKLPREIPDSFVTEFLGWCRDHGIKGKYSMVPYPACTGWLNRFIPGWSRKELAESLQLVRDKATAHWDIHPEMISHTRVIDIKSGLPFPGAAPEFMENWEWSQTRSADELGEYIGYALRVLKDVGFDCDGVTTPGGFGHRNISNLALGTKYAVADVFGHSVAHFFRDVVLDPLKSIQPDVMHVTGINSNDARCAVHIKACTGDWFGGWDGLTPGNADRYISQDGQTGRLVEAIEAGGPAVFICHWPGIYYNGTQLGFDIFKTVIHRLEEHYENLHWMKLTDIASYWASMEHTEFSWDQKGLQMQVPFATRDFTFTLPRQPSFSPYHYCRGKKRPLTKVSSEKELRSNSYAVTKDKLYCCLDLPKGQNLLALKA